MEEFSRAERFQDSFVTSIAHSLKKKEKKKKKEEEEVFLHPARNY